MVIRNGSSEHFCFIFNVREQDINISLFSTTFAVGLLLEIKCITLRRLISIPSLIRGSFLILINY